jgi:tRNA (guanine6-N2)-methyltransferase
MPPRQATPVYIAQTQPGFEAIAADEIAANEGALIRTTLSIGDKNGMVIFEYPHDPSELMELRTIEDLFEQVLVVTDLPPTFAALRELGDGVERATIEPALQRARQIRPGRGGHGKLRYRVVARQVGETHYRRVDAQVAVEKAIARRADHSWRLDEEGGLEFWLTLFPDEALLALRLSDEKMRHRTYKIEHIPASLRPSAAAALVFLTKPSEHDRFLDPMCGAGTILIERAHFGRYRMLLGGDESLEALAVAQENVGTRYQPIELHEWDARSLPLDANSITAAAVNLPFGKQIGSVEDNRVLYPDVLRELARVMRPAARLALISGDITNLSDSLRRSGAFREKASYPVLIMGRRARVVVVQRN